MSQYAKDIIDISDRLFRYAEPAATLVTGAAAEPLSGLYGLANLAITRNPDAAANAVNQAQRALTYQPRTAQGQAGLRGLQDILQPIADVVQGASQNLGDKAYGATGSPALAAAAYSAPTAMLEALGLKGLSIAKSPVKAADLYTPRIFAGVNAKTADLAALDKAKALEKAGINRTAIWEQTGWFNDGGDWKFEISDDAASFAPGDLPTMKIEGEDFPDVGFSKMSDALRHNSLFSAYPQLSELGFATNPNMPFGVVGRYTDEGIELNKLKAKSYVKTQEDWVNRQQDPESPDYWERQAEEAFNRGEYPTLDDAKNDLRKWLDYDISDLQKMKQDYWTGEDLNTTIHELQHAVQSIEGFNRGGNPSYARRAMDIGRQSELGPLSKSKYLFDAAGDKYKTTWAKMYISDLERIAQKESPKPSEITNLSDWYQYSDEIRDRFGPQPKSPGANRDAWVKSAAAFLRNKAIESSGIRGMSNPEIAQQLLNERAQIKKDLMVVRRDMDKHSKGSQKYGEIERKYEALKRLSNEDLYKRLGGEAEARLTESRLKMSQEERRNKFPLDYLDVPESEIIPSKR